MDNAVMSGTATPVPETAKEAPRPRKRGTQHPDRVWIGADALNRLSGWIAEVNSKLQGVAITRSDLVNFIVLSHAEALSATELKEIEARYFDPIKHAQWARAELEAALARGEKVTLVDIVLNNRATAASVSRTRKPKAELSKNSENPEKNAQKQSHSSAQETLISVEKSTE